MRSLAVTPPAALPDLSGYEIVRRLGVSASSEVLLAVARGPYGFARTVVLKRLVTETSDGHARLAREARAYARLTHPAIVRLYDFVEDAGRLTLVLEHVDGVSLKRVMEAGRSARLDDASVWYVGYRIFLALAAAHAAREPMTREFAPVIHRDVSPGNVLVPWDGYVKLSDFGIARLAGVADDTRPGVIKGTVGYLAPEQVRGETVSVRTDVYAACLVLRELLLGAPVFPGAGQTEMERLAAMAAPRLLPLAALRPGLPVAVTDALDRGLSAEPDRRSVTAEEMASLLRSVVDVELARARLVAFVARLRRTEAPRTVAHATRPDTSASLFDESSHDLETDADTTADAPQQAVASSMVM
ncbi:MAG TPA: serine/threonine-protein kinase, partial [Labilithrix sp.]|nr:serine/threonine-protein kinase [Labilithrix sp.]